MIKSKYNYNSHLLFYIYLTVVENCYMVIEDDHYNPVLNKVFLYTFRYLKKLNRFIKDYHYHHRYFDKYQNNNKIIITRLMAHWHRINTYLMSLDTGSF